MEKYIIKWSYMAGVLALSLAFLVRGIDLVNPHLSLIRTGGDSIGYLAFMHAAFLLFVTTIAATCYAWFKAQSAQASAPERVSASLPVEQQAMPRNAGLSE